jgi:uncharacterized damage-inducible protein DinB
MWGEKMNPADREILDHFARVREKTIELFEQMPDEMLGRKADGEDMTLGWLFMHIADGPDWWMEHCMQDGRGWIYPGDGPFQGEEIKGALQASLRRITEFFQAGDGERMGESFELDPEKTEGEGCWTGRNRVLYLAAHEVHHRGKMVLALRQWGADEFPFMPE